VNFNHGVRGGKFRGHKESLIYCLKTTKALAFSVTSKRPISVFKIEVHFRNGLRNSLIHMIIIFLAAIWNLRISKIIPVRDVFIMLDFSVPSVVNLKYCSRTNAFFTLIPSYKLTGSDAFLCSFEDHV
jgi:hypothetical protein